VAEYTAAIRALEWLITQGFRGQVLLYGDSELVVRQMEGEYQVRAEHLKAYKQHLDQLVQRFEGVKFGWIPREENTRADELSKRAFELERPSARRHRPPTLPAAEPEE
jgi:ribonuclease HI